MPGDDCPAPAAAIAGRAAGLKHRSTGFNCAICATGVRRLMTGQHQYRSDEAADDIFVRARRDVTIRQAVLQRRGSLTGRGDKLRGACPLCSAGAKSKSAPFVIDQAEGWFKCHGCGAGGDVIKFEQLAGGHDRAIDAARALLNEILPAAKAREARAPVRAEAAAPKTVDSTAMARLILAEAVPAAGTIVEAWLWARGLNPHGLPGGVSGLLFHPAAPAWAWPVDGGPDDVRRVPAMIAPISGPDGRAWPACHVTYLAADGRAKAAVKTPRKILGQYQGGAVWLCRTVGANPMVVGEGIESAWALGAAMRARSVAAALSLDNLQGGAMRGPAGELMLPVAADPARPPFLVRGARDVVIGIDADMSPVKVKVRAGGIVRDQVELGARARAELCAELACQHWRRVGAAPRAERPAWGQDFNDAAAAVAGREHG